MDNLDIVNKLILGYPFPLLFMCVLFVSRFSKIKIIDHLKLVVLAIPLLFSFVHSGLNNRLFAYYVSFACLFFLLVGPVGRGTRAIAPKILPRVSLVVAAISILIWALTAETYEYRTSLLFGWNTDSALILMLLSIAAFEVNGGKFYKFLLVGLAVCVIALGQSRSGLLLMVPLLYFALLKPQGPMSLRWRFISSAFSVTIPMVAGMLILIMNFDNRDDSQLHGAWRLLSTSDESILERQIIMSAALVGWSQDVGSILFGLNLSDMFSMNSIAMYNSIHNSQFELLVAGGLLFFLFYNVLLIDVLAKIMSLEIFVLVFCYEVAANVQTNMMYGIFPVLLALLILCAHLRQVRYQNNSSRTGFDSTRQ